MEAIDYLTSLAQVVMRNKRLRIKALVPPPQPTFPAPSHRRTGRSVTTEGTPTWGSSSLTTRLTDTDPDPVRRHGRIPLPAVTYCAEGRLIEWKLPVGIAQPHFPVGRDARTKGPGRSLLALGWGFL
jgi:hypothetical protein